jgi:hypothetical protein
LVSAKKKVSIRPVLLNPLKAVPASKYLSKPFPAQKSLKPKEIIDLGVISLRSYRLSPPLSPLEPLPPSSPSSLPPVVRHMTPA